MIDRFLMSLAEEDAQLEEQFNDRVCELLNNEWNPDSFDNVMDAIHDDCLYPIREKLEYAILHNDFTEYGRLIFKQVEEWCIGKAEDQANEEFARGLN